MQSSPVGSMMSRPCSSASLMDRSESTIKRSRYSLGPDHSVEAAV
jgi:hypothetical protein